MSKNFFQDVVPPQRSIRNIPINGVRRKKTVPTEEDAVMEENPYTLEKPQFTNDYEPPREVPGGRKKLKGKAYLYIAIIVVVGFIVSMMTVFTSATINITPKSETISFNTAIKAEKNPQPQNPSLHYEVVDIKKEGQIEVQANGEEMAEKKASGTITIYNNFNSEPQRLIARTRFESPEGLIYRISESVTVPGKTATEPGTLDVTVFADEAGEKYNIGKVDFTIPGFKTDAVRYKGFYAKSKTEMSGGFVGKVKKVSENDKSVALKNLEETLKKDLEKDAEAKIPDGFVKLNGSTMYEFKELSQGNSAGSAAVLRLEGTAHVVVFNKLSLASTIARQFIEGWQTLPVEIKDFKDMALTFDTGANITSLTLPVKITGTATVRALVNGAEVAEKIKGKPKSELNNILSQFAGVSTAKATVRPIWKSSFPSDAAKIYINLE